MYRSIAVMTLGLHRLNVWLVFPALLLIMLGDILLRACCKTSLSWGHEVLGLLLLNLFFLELPYLVQRREFLQVDALYLRLGTHGRHRLNQCASLLILVFALLTGGQGAMATLDMLEYGERAYSLPIPHWPFSMLITASGLLMAAQALTQLLGLPIAPAAGKP